MRLAPLTLLFVILLTVTVTPRTARAQDAAGMTDSGDVSEAAIDTELRAQLDAPLLFVKRHSYTGIHIYDTYYKWPPGGGGIYVLENPAAPRDTWRMRAVIDPATPETLGSGVYTHPELSWDAKRLLFCFKREADGNTSIYEIGVDGAGLRRVTDPAPSCGQYKGSLHGQHDIAPAYLPDGRIVFLSTRPSGLVPCNNTGVAILHVMNADGSDIHPISVNNVNEFDPSILPDGRILFGRWEYIDKNALTIQSLWTVNPDGTQETALYANNMVFPEAILDARPVPGSPWIVGTFAKHNAPPRGSIALVDPRRGKNSLEAIVNLEHPDRPDCDTGDSCEPWPVSQDLFLLSGRPAGAARSVIEMLDRSGCRSVLLADPDICLHSPMLIKPRPRPPILAETVDRTARTGRFYVQDIYDGLLGVKRGTVKWLRVIEETSRASEASGGPNPYNQTFLLSCALAFSVKNVLGIVPVEPDGSAYFEVPVGRAVYWQALDGDGRLVQSMRTFVQAAPGATRSCIGCHEHKFTAAPLAGDLPAVLHRGPSPLAPESWGSGYIDYPTMVQPVLNRHCVRCHGGEEGMSAGLDLSGGWTEHFNISYESLTNRCETQLMAYWIAGIDCMNGTALWSSRIFPPRAHGSGAAPLAKQLVSGHKGRLWQLSRAERDLLMAWMDTNGLYYGTWDRTAGGSAIAAWDPMKGAITEVMRDAGCLACHGDDQGQLVYFENDWVNLERPEFSRILRAPLAKHSRGYGLAWCRDRKVTPDRRRVHLLWNGYAHAVLPPEAFERHQRVEPDRTGEPVVTYASPEDAHYQAMLRIIRQAREAALTQGRVDMPGADVLAGDCRWFCAPELTAAPAALAAEVTSGAAVALSWPRTADTIGLRFELHRGATATFDPTPSTLLSTTPLFSFTDWQAPPGPQHYALVPVADGRRGAPLRANVHVPASAPPLAPTEVQATAASGVVVVTWQNDAPVAGYEVLRRGPGEAEFVTLTPQPLRRHQFADLDVSPGERYAYVVRAVSRRGEVGLSSPVAEAVAEVLLAPAGTWFWTDPPRVELHEGGTLPATLHGTASLRDGALMLGESGYATVPHDAAWDLHQPLTVICRVRLDAAGQMPVLISFGAWNQAGWFLQQIGNTWRWHVGGVDCDGGRPELGRWTQLACIYDGRAARLYQDGALVAQRPGPFIQDAWSGPLHVGQYSGGPAPAYHVAGQIGDVRLYHRALSDAEVIAQQPRAGPISRADP